MTKTASGFVVLMKENVSRFEFKNFKVNTHTKKKTIYKLLYMILKSHGMKQNDGLFVREEGSTKERSRGLTLNPLLLHVKGVVLSWAATDGPQI